MIRGQAFPDPLPPLQGREPWERLTVGGYCPTCSDLLRALRTRRTSARLLAKARPAGTVERDGREFELLSWQQLCVVYGFRARLLTSKQRSQRPHYGQARKRRGQGSARCDDGRGAASFARSPPGWPLAQWKLSPFWPGSFIGLCASGPRTPQDLELPTGLDGGVPALRLFDSPTPASWNKPPARPTRARAAP